MGRWAFAILAALSLAACVAMMGLALRSYRTGDSAKFRGPPTDGTMRMLQIDSVGGGLYIDFTTKSVVPAESPGAGWLWEIETEYGRRPQGFSYESFPLDRLSWVQAWQGSTNFVWEAFSATSRPDGDLRHLVRTDIRTIGFPHWLLAAALAILPASWCWLRFRRSRRRRAGACSDCEYDLRASPERCPECGRPADRPPVVARLR